VGLQLGFRTPVLELARDFNRRAGDAAAAAQWAGELAAYECAVEYTPAQCGLVRDGELSGYLDPAYQIPAFIALTGAYVTPALYDQLVQRYGGAALTELGIAPNSTYCPPRALDGAPCACNASLIAAAGTACDLACQRAELLGSGGPTESPVGNIASNLVLSDAAGRAKAMSELPAGARVLATNSWTDADIPLRTFAPLHALLQANLSTVRYAYPPTPTAAEIHSVGAASLTAVTFANLTHPMYDVNAPLQPAATPPFAVRVDVLDTITNWVCTGVPCTGAAPPPPPDAGREWQLSVPLVTAIAGGGAAVGGVMGATVMWAMLRGGFANTRALPAVLRDPLVDDTIRS
jgi:hypothetical protein